MEIAFVPVWMFVLATLATSLAVCLLYVCIKDIVAECKDKSNKTKGKR